MSDDHGHGEVHAEPVATNILSREQLLFMYGFVKKSYRDEWDEKYGKVKSISKRRAMVQKIPLTDLKKKIDEETAEIADEAFDRTGFPGSPARYKLVLESASENVEDSYFDILQKIRQDRGFPYVHKVSDYFAASENSAFFGNSQQRIGIQQDRVQQFLANIGKFVKELFQMVRELRIIDERLAIYEASGGLVIKRANARNSGHNGHDGHGDHGHGGHDHGHETKQSHSQAADVTLKGIFVDMVEGGTKSPQSVLGLAQQVGFTLLPDLFFNEYVAKKEDVDRHVDNLKYNQQLKNVLKRKLYQYLVWKEKTYNELVARRQFNLKYLRQHWSIIKMYMAWAKPYLRNIERLTMKQDAFESPDLIAAFETAMIEVEFLAYKQPVSGYHPVILASFAFRSRPDMSVRREYQQGPVHVGRMDMTLRAYAWTPEQIEAYKAMKKREEIELLGILDSSLSDIMEALGEEFEDYLKEAGEDLYKEEPDEPHKPKQDGALAPFASLFGGFKEIFEAFIPIGKGDGHDDHGHGGSPKKAFDSAASAAGITYHTYKKGKRMITW